MTETVTLDPETFTVDGLTAAEWEARARGSEQAKQDSFDRCDTDGFLSQWASGVMAGEHFAKARLARNFGKTDSRALFDLDGNLVAAKYVETRYGMAWGLLSDPTNPRSRFQGWINESNAATPEKRRAALERKGYRLGYVRTDGRVVMTGQSRTSVRAITIRADEGWDPNADVVSTDDIDAY